MAWRNSRTGFLFSHIINCLSEFGSAKASILELNYNNETVKAYNLEINHLKYNFAVQWYNTLLLRKVTLKQQGRQITFRFNFDKQNS